jgi:hypothetical protein
MRGMIEREGWPAVSRWWGRWRQAAVRWVGLRIGDGRFGGRPRSVTRTDMSGFVGRVMTFPEGDYRFGTGALRLRLERVDATHPFVEGGERWYWVEATQVTSSGEDLRSRIILVRGRHLGG